MTFSAVSVYTEKGYGPVGMEVLLLFWQSAGKMNNATRTSGDHMLLDVPEDDCLSTWDLGAGLEARTPEEEDIYLRRFSGGELCHAVRRVSCPGARSHRTG